MKNKKLILSVIALVAVIAIFLGVYLATRPEAQEGSKTITITVVHSNGTSKDFTCHTDARFLADVMLAEGLFLSTEGADGMYYTVDGETASWETNKAYWALYIGEEYAMVGAKDTPVNDGDSFKWVYTIGE